MPRPVPLLLSLLLASPGAAGPGPGPGPLTGKWRLDTPDLEYPDQSGTWEVRDGTFACARCRPAVRVAADGGFHRVAGYRRFDELSVDASRPDRLTFTYRRGGRWVGVSGQTVSPDGAILDGGWRFDGAGGPPLDGGQRRYRLGALPAGAHRASGSWALLGDRAPPEPTVVSFDVRGRTVRAAKSRDVSYEAVLGGPPVPVRGEPGVTVSVAAPAPGVLEETERENGRVTGVARYTVAPDGRTLELRIEADGRSASITAERQ